MASRTLNPLRRAVLSRGIATASKPLQFRGTAAAREGPTSTATAAAPPRPASSSYASANGARPPPAAASKPAPKPDALAAAAPAPPPTPSRVPVPPVSGESLPDAQPTPDDGTAVDWTSSFLGLGTSAFPPEVSSVLLAPLNPDDIEVKPDGIIYLPEIKYRRVLNMAFGPGGWGLAPRGDLVVKERMVTREYALIVNGRFVAQARGEQQYFSEDGISTAAEGCKSNSLMRCCKDLGIASELWDPRYIRKFTKQYAQQVWCEHVVTKKKKQIWLRKDDEVRYPFKRS